MNRWVFLFKSAGSDPAVHHTELEHPGKRLLVYGVESNAQAVEIIRMLDETQAAEGPCLYAELCGAFCPADVAEISALADVDIPIGCVCYTPEERKKIRS